jgi:ABC-2 type transport system permease protein
LALIVNAFVIATAFHIAILALAIITLEIDHTVMIYRDLTNLGKLPVDIYKEPLKSFLTYLVPIGIMMTVPVKALIGMISFIGVVGSVAIGCLSIFLALKFWRFALKKYTSASS